MQRSRPLVLADQSNRLLDGSRDMTAAHLIALGIASRTGSPDFIDDNGEDSGSVSDLPRISLKNLFRALWVLHFFAYLIHAFPRCVAIRIAFVFF